MSYGDIDTVILSKKTQSDLKFVPDRILRKLMAWADDVRENGISIVRMRPGFHDEPLKGKRKGQRSIRLNRAYRAIYCIDESGTVRFIEVLEVNKHDY